MNSLKCLECGLVNFASSTICKKCKNSLTEMTLESSESQPNSASQSQSCIRSTSQTTSIQPSIISIAKNDFGALMGAMVPLMLWGMFIAKNVFGLSLSRRGRSLPTDDNDSTFLYIAIAGTIIGIALLAWRIYSFQQTFANGEEIIGRITNISFVKDRGRIEYSYSLRGQAYQSGNAIMKNRTTQSFQNGAEVELIVDRLNPKRAFVITLYS